MNSGVTRKTTSSRKSADGKILLSRRSDSKNQLRKKKGLKRKKTYPDGHHPNSKKRWWKKGQSGNPKGRPRKDVCITSLVKQYLGEIADSKTGITHEALAAEALVAGLIDLNPTAVKEVLARVDGAVKQKIEMEGSSSVEISVGDLAREFLKRKKKKKKKPKRRKHG